MITAISPAIANEAPVKPEPPKPTMTIDECMTVLAGLEALDGYTTIIKEGKPDAQVVVRSYVFGNGALRDDIAQNLTALRDVRRSTQETQNAIVKEIGKGANDIPAQIMGPDGKQLISNPDYVEYVRQVNQLTAKPCNAIPVPIRLKDLKLDINEIPNSTISNLGKILVRDK
jgi:hypothetical protein